jgi:Gpi18-like mannosyltransferase
MPMNHRNARAALLAFLLSRALFFALIVIGSNVAFVRKVYNDRIWETKVELQRGRIGPQLIITVMNGDAWFYRSIATSGYERRPFAPGAANWAFFPLYPLAVRMLGGDYAVSGMLLSNAALLAALLLLGPLTQACGGSDDDAARAVFYAAFFPTSYFLSMPLPESLFFFLTIAAFFAAQRERWWLAGIAGALAAATRPAGVLLLPALALLAIERRAWRRAAWLLLIPLGTAAFMLHLYRLTGNAFAFAGVQGSWNRHASMPWTPLLAFLRNPSVAGEPWNLIALNFIAALLILAAAIWFLARSDWPHGSYALLSLLLPLSSGSLQSMGRYAAVAFPLFIALAFLGRRAAIDRVIVAVSIALFGWLIALLTLRVDFALA